MTRLFSHEAADLEPCLEAAERETALGLKDLVGAKDVWQTCGRLFPVAKTSPPCGKGVARGSGRVARVCVEFPLLQRKQKERHLGAGMRVVGGFVQSLCAGTHAPERTTCFRVDV